MTANVGSPACVDENNRNLDNMDPLALDGMPMEVDKEEENSESDPLPMISKEQEEEEARELHQRKSKQFIQELYKFHENAGYVSSYEHTLLTVINLPEFLPLTLPALPSSGIPRSMERTWISMNYIRR